MAYAQGPRAPAVCRRSTGGQPSQPRSCSPRPALCGGATEKDGPPDCRRLPHPQLRYPLGRAWDPLSHPLSHHIRPEQSRVLSTYGTHSPPTSGTPTPGHSVASNRKFSFPRTIVISNGYLFFSGRNFGLGRGLIAVTLQPCVQLGALAVGLLAFEGGYPDRDGGAHGARRSARRASTSMFSWNTATIRGFWPLGLPIRSINF